MIETLTQTIDHLATITHDVGVGAWLLVAVYILLEWFTLRKTIREGDPNGICAVYIAITALAGAYTLFCGSWPVLALYLSLDIAIGLVVTRNFGPPVSRQAAETMPVTVTSAAAIISTIYFAAFQWLR